MTSQGHVTTASIKQVHKEANREVSFYPPISQKVLRIHPWNFSLQVEGP